MGFRGPQVQILSPRLSPIPREAEVAPRLCRRLPSPAHEPLTDRSAPATVIELDQKDVVVLTDQLSLGSVLEVAAPSVPPREIASDPDRFLPSPRRGPPV